MTPPNAVDKTKEAAISFHGDGERLNVIGDAQTIKLDGTTTNGAFTPIEQNNLPGTRVPVHVHTSEDETFYICDGEVVFQVGEIEVPASAGTTVYLPRRVPHGFHLAKPTHSLLRICPTGAERLFRNLTELPQGPPDMERVKGLCAEFGIYSPQAGEKSITACRLRSSQEPALMSLERVPNGTQDAGPCDVDVEVAESEPHEKGALHSRRTSSWFISRLNRHYRPSGSMP
jgi:mannose-6-phosphate isomerase-like protein (cupin superfamily)